MQDFSQGRRWASMDYLERERSTRALRDAAIHDALAGIGTAFKGWLHRHAARVEPNRSLRTPMGSPR